MKRKSTVNEIRRRFDREVERFSDLETGQTATMDAPLVMELITRAAIVTTQPIRRVLDLGCGAGNCTLRLLRDYSGDFACDLCDLSRPMLERAEKRLARESRCAIRLFHGDFRDMEFEASAYDVVLAAAVLHHLRGEQEWEDGFRQIYRLLRPGGSFWISDLVAHEDGHIQSMMWQRYGKYLVSLGGTEYRDRVFAYIDQEDSPRSVTWQLELLRQVGFDTVEILHKNSCFAAFGAIKSREIKQQ